MGVAIDPVSHRIVVTDSGTNLVRIYSSTGIYVGQVGGSGQFVFPTDVAIDPKTSNIVVTDGGLPPPHDNVQIFASTGSYLGGFATPTTQGSYSYGVVIDPVSDNIVVATPIDNFAQIFDPAPPPATESFSPSTVVVTRDSIYSSSMMKITLTNTQAAAISGVAFDDIYPAGIANCTGVVVQSNRCSGALTSTSGGFSTQLTDGTIPANACCSVVVRLVGTVLGVWANPTGPVTSNVGQFSAGASASLTVKPNHIVICPPGGGTTCSWGTADQFHPGIDQPSRVRHMSVKHLRA